MAVREEAAGGVRARGLLQKAGFVQLVLPLPPRFVIAVHHEEEPEEEDQQEGEADARVGSRDPLPAPCAHILPFRISTAASAYSFSRAWVLSAESDTALT